MPFNAGENVGPYRIIEQLGQGGMATVYKAYHASLDRFVAIKVLHPAFREDQNFLGRFQREARVVARLEHPNIVPIYDYAEQDGQPYLVMKYIEGDTLKARIKHSPIPPEEVQRIVEAAGAGLSYAHKRGILHRDIKPSNVILATDGQIYLADFGLARIAQSGESSLTSDTVLGTPQYISPEQAIGKSELDEGTDIYSFGVMLYELTVGRVPFSSDTPFSVIHDHIYSPLPMPTSVNPKVSPDVERILLKALAKNRADRYADVDALVSAFKEAWKTGAAPAAPVTIEIPTTPQGSSAPTVSAPIGSAVQAPSASILTVIADPAPQADNVGSTVTPAKRKWKWWQLLLGGMMLCFCCVFALAVRDNNIGNGSVATLEPVELTIQAGIQTMLPNQTLQAAIITAIPEPTFQSMMASAIPQVVPSIQSEITIETARQNVQQNPEDPSAHLELAIALWDSGRGAESASATDVMINLPNIDEAFLEDAGTRFFIETENWVSAALVYFSLAQYAVDQKEQLAPELRDHLDESVYRASAEPHFVRYIEQFKDKQSPLALVAQARSAKLNGFDRVADKNLADLISAMPDWHLTKLLQGEFYMLDGKNTEASAFFDQLLSDEGTPLWVLDQVELFLSQLP